MSNAIILWLLFIALISFLCGRVYESARHKRAAREIEKVKRGY